MVTIKEEAFYGLSKVKTIKIPDSVTSISYGAFRGCNSLQTIVLPFVGKTRTSTGFEGTFGYIFGYATYDSYTSSSDTSKYIFDATTKTRLSTNYYGYQCYGGTTASTAYVDKVVSTDYSKLSYGFR